MTQRPGYITLSSDVPPRPLTQTEAQDVFTAIAAMSDRIAFRYLLEGCECRAQLMIEELLARGISPGRAWAVMVARPLVVPSPDAPKRLIKWFNHTAPTIALDATSDGVRVIDPGVTTTGTLTLADWAAEMGTKAILISQLPAFPRANPGEPARTRSRRAGTGCRCVSPASGSGARSRKKAALGSSSAPTPKKAAARSPVERWPIT